MQTVGLTCRVQSSTPGRPAGNVDDMRVTHLGHACLLVESTATRILLDPGTYSAGFEGLTGLSAILVTHQHPDHLDMQRLPALRHANPDALLLLEPEAITGHDFGSDATAMAPGDQARVGDIDVCVVGGQHAVNHDQVPPLGNVGYLLTTGDTTVFHPGDSYNETPDDVDVLALPLNAPWCRMSETLGFLRAVGPRVVLPIHNGLLNDHGRAAYLMHIERFGPDETDVIDLRPGESYDA